MHVLRRFLLTLSYVTSLPLKKQAVQHEASQAETTESQLAGLAKYLPSAGLLIGTILVGIAALCLLKLHAPHAVTGALLAIAWLCLTGGLHFDGLMDTADGIFSHRSKERVLEIMMDSRVGNFGAMTGMCVLIAKVVALITLCSKPLLLLAVLILAPAWARWCELYAIGRFPYAKDEGKGKIWHDSTSVPNDFMVGMLPLLAVSAYLVSISGMATVLAVIAFTLMSGLFASHWLANHIAGHTGDTYGAVVELAETGCLILSAAILLH